MATLPASGYIENAARTVAEQKAALEAVRDVLSTHEGGSTRSEITISSGAAAPTTRDHGGNVTIDTEGDASTDDLDVLTYTNLPDGSVVRLWAENASRVVTLKHGNGGAGEMLMVDSADFVLDALDKWIQFQRRGTSWVEINRSAYDVVRQIVVATSTTDDTISATSATDTSLSGSITPRFADSKVIVQCFGRTDIRHDGVGSSNSARLGFFDLQRSSGTPAVLALVTIGVTLASADASARPGRWPLSIVGSEVPGAGTHTYVLRGYVNETYIDLSLQGSAGVAATMILMEVAP